MTGIRISTQKRHTKQGRILPQDERGSEDPTVIMDLDLNCSVRMRQSLNQQEGQGKNTADVSDQKHNPALEPVSTTCFIP